VSRAAIAEELPNVLDVEPRPPASRALRRRRARRQPIGVPCRLEPRGSARTASGTSGGPAPCGEGPPRARKDLTSAMPLTNLRRKRSRSLRRQRRAWPPPSGWRKESERPKPLRGQIGLGQARSGKRSYDINLRLVGDRGRRASFRSAARRGCRKNPAPWWGESKGAGPRRVEHTVRFLAHQAAHRM
jgi:hypothetical protein